MKRIDFDTPIGGVELAKEGDVLTVATGSKVIFYEAGTFEKMKEVSVSCPVYSASLNKAQDIFVCGGEDLKLYKFDYQTGIEIDNFKGHFGPVHCVRFSPDGELYASGSEDGTLRLWQTEVPFLNLNIICQHGFAIFVNTVVGKCKSWLTAGGKDLRPVEVC